MILAVVLGPSLDVTFLVEELRLGQIHRPVETLACAGGKGLNMARAAHRLGADVAAVVGLGGATGARIADLLRVDGVPQRGFATSAESRTCVSLGSLAEPSLTEVYMHPVPLSRADVRAAEAALADALAECSPGWVTLNGGMPPGVETSDLLRLSDTARAAGAKVAIDTYGAALAALVEHGVDLVKINRAEAEGLLGARDDLAALTAALLQRCGCAVVVTDGAEGSACAEPGGTVLRRPAPKRRGGFPVGSGDSFFGALLTALDGGARLPDAAALGAAAGTANALVPGPGVFDADLVRELAAAL